jgi:hypothetical protein
MFSEKCQSELKMRDPSRTAKSVNRTDGSAAFSSLAPVGQKSKQKAWSSTHLHVTEPKLLSIPIQFIRWSQRESHDCAVL